MLWLDSTYPTDSAAGALGTQRGPCATSSGDPKDVESQTPDASVTFSDIKFGPIDSTY
jgi:cellulose 1,4-beta-cellobiosidase